MNAEGAEKGKFIEIIHEKLLGTYFFTILQDWKNIPFAITVTSVTLLLNEALPQWDNEIQGKTNQQKRDYVILGTDRGYIYIVDIKNREHYYTRLNYHSNNVTSVQRIYIKNSEENKELYFLSMTENKEIALWMISMR